MCIMRFFKFLLESINWYNTRQAVYTQMSWFWDCLTDFFVKVLNNFFAWTQQVIFKLPRNIITVRVIKFEYKIIFTYEINTISYNYFQYLGDWYEIKKFFFFIEGAETCIRANYSLKPDGHIQVFNRGIK